jgi:hypothetical protein
MNRGTLHMSAECFAEFLNLKPGVHVVGAEYDAKTNTVDFHFIGPNLPSVVQGGASPWIDFQEISNGLQR